MNCMCYFELSVKEQLSLYFYASHSVDYLKKYLLYYLGLLISIPKSPDRGCVT
jgi:hypothetical protein